ncbi:MAG TPA: hypothetical protein VD997_14295 [Phycisphaerales bacterium]|nr:hypothetical protein [Phycisphaerales bacterium]
MAFCDFALLMSDGSIPERVELDARTHGKLVKWAESHKANALIRASDIYGDEVEYADSELEALRLDTSTMAAAPDRELAGIAVALLQLSDRALHEKARVVFLPN